MSDEQDLFRRIVVGVDLTADGEPTTGSRRALALARSLAGRGAGAGAERIVLLHARHGEGDERWRSDDGDFGWESSAPAGRAREAIEREAAALRDAGVPSEACVLDGTAWLEIVRHVRANADDLVLVGRRSEVNVDARPLGSVAMKLLRKCPCPVWVVRPDRDPSVRRVLVASDLGPVSRRIVRVAAAVAERCTAELHVVHAVQLTMAVQHEGDDAVTEFVEERRAAAREQIARELGDAFADTARLHVGLTSPTRAVLSGVREIDADVVVMGTIARGGVAGLLVGNTAERLLGRLETAILAVKPEDFVCPVTD